MNECREAYKLSQLPVVAYMNKFYNAVAILYERLFLHDKVQATMSLITNIKFVQFLVLSKNLDRKYGR